MAILKTVRIRKGVWPKNGRGLKQAEPSKSLIEEIRFYNKDIDVKKDGCR